MCIQAHVSGFYLGYFFLFDVCTTIVCIHAAGASYDNDPWRGVIMKYRRGQIYGRHQKKFP